MQTRSVHGGRLRLPRLLVSMQMALCLAALVAAGLLGRTLDNLEHSDVGFEREHLAYASMSPARAGYAAEQIGPYVDRVREQLIRLPGVLHVSPVQTQIALGRWQQRPPQLPGAALGRHASREPESSGRRLFDTLRIPLLSGRTLDRHDMRPDADAVVVDDTFAPVPSRTRIPLGRRFGLDPTTNQRYQIVGVVGKSLYNSLRTDASPTIYQPYRPGRRRFILRSARRPSPPASPTLFERRWLPSNPRVPLTEFHTQRGLIRRLLRTETLLSVMSNAFGWVALAVAAIGLGGLLIYAVARRTSEIGVPARTRRDRLRCHSNGGTDSLGMVVTGMLLGLPCALRCGRRS